MLKFGRLVDLERLENVTVNRTAEELKERLRQQESQNANELAKWEVNYHYYKCQSSCILASHWTRTYHVNVVQFNWLLATVLSSAHYFIPTPSKFWPPI